MVRYSSDYEEIRSSIMENWPEWKKRLANALLLTSVHAKKLPVKETKEIFGGGDANV